MNATLLLIHGRDNDSPPEIAKDPARLQAFIEAKKRDWLAGLSRGLLQAGLAPVTEAVMPFYANAFRQRIREYEASGGQRPDLELGIARGPEPDGEQQRSLQEIKSAALTDLLRKLDFDPARELGYTDPGLAAQLPEGARAEELGWEDLLRVPVLRAGLQFLGRKTGVPAVIIEEFLTDVAYYLRLRDMRDSVLAIVHESLRTALPHGGQVVVVGHSLGSIVAYDYLTRLEPDFDLQQFTTAGSPLGFPIVEANLLGKETGKKPSVPKVVPARRGGWVNAYDVRDFVSLMHPLASDYDAAAEGQLADERTFNATYPHSIVDYLSDPDVAGPIGRALGNKP